MKRLLILLTGVVLLQACAAIECAKDKKALQRVLGKQHLVNQVLLQKQPLPNIQWRPDGSPRPLIPLIPLFDSTWIRLPISSTNAAIGDSFFIRRVPQEPVKTIDKR